MFHREIDSLPGTTSNGVTPRYELDLEGVVRNQSCVPVETTFQFRKGTAGRAGFSG